MNEPDDRGLLAPIVSTVYFGSNPDAEIAIFGDGEIEAVEPTPDGGVRRLAPPPAPPTVGGRYVDFDSDTIKVTLIDPKPDPKP